MDSVQTIETRSRPRQELTVGLCQINASFSGNCYLPYSVGLLEAYARNNLRDPSRYRFLLPVYKRDPVAEAVLKLLPADIVGVSLYVWNAQLSLAIARELKRQKPEMLVVFGGPHVPDRSEAFLRENDFVDVAIHGEGEQIFSAILENPDDWRSIPSLSFLKNGTYFQNPRAPRIKDLDSLPSPYLSGTFDRLMASVPDAHWIVVWETNRGCPFSCTYCDWGSATAAKISKWEIDRLFREMDWFAEHRIEFITGADANFGILPRDIEIAEYCAEVKRKTGFPQRLSFSATKNATERSLRIYQNFSDSDLNAGVNVAMQSTDPETLKAIRRDNIKLETFRTVQQWFQRAGVQTTTDIILGLPGETYDSFANGLSELIANGQHDHILVFNCGILPNAEMNDPVYREQYGIESITSRIINSHGARSDNEGDIPEFQHLVVATKSMPREDWARGRAFAWTMQLLHLDKLLQIPFVLAHELGGISYRELIELFSEGGSLNAREFPTLTSIREFFLAKARDIQTGGEEFCHSARWLDMFWVADEYMLIELATLGKLAAFYKEADRALTALLARHGKEEYCPAVSEAIFLNGHMLKQPFRTGNQTLETAYNVWEFYRSVLRGDPAELQNHSRRELVIDHAKEHWDSWEDWCRHVVWYGNKRGAYLYDGKASERLIAGHY